MFSPSFNHSSPLSALSVRDDDSAAKESACIKSEPNTSSNSSSCAYVKSESNSSGNGSFEHDQAPSQRQHDRHDNLVIDIATVLTKMYRVSDKGFYQPSPSTSQQTSPVANTSYRNLDAYGCYHSTSSSYQQQTTHYAPSGTDGRSQNYATLQSSHQAQSYTPISSYRPGYDLSPNTYSNMAQGLRLDHTYTSMPYNVPQFTSLFRSPWDRGVEFLSGMDEIREWKCENTSVQQPQLHRDNASVATWDSEAETAVVTCPMNDTRCADHETSYNPIPKSLQELLAAVTKLSKTSNLSPPKPATRPARRQKRKATDVPVVPEEKREKRVQPVFTTLTNLTNHDRTHKKSKKRLECEICQKTYSTKSTLAVHMRIHTGETPYHCTATGCKRQFRDLSTFTKHRRVHSGEKPYKCLFCGAGFTQTGNLNRHVVKLHPCEF